MSREAIIGVLMLLLSADPSGQLWPTNWPLKVLSWDIDKAYPGVEYNYRLAVQGGAYPYTFTILTGPAGMAIDEKKGILTWIPSGESLSNKVTIKIVDADQRSLFHEFYVDATSHGFYFVTSSGSDTLDNDGSESEPWATMAYASVNAEKTGYIYVKAGTYVESFSLSNNSCGRFFAYPGDMVTVLHDGGTNSSAIGMHNVEDFIFHGFTFDAQNKRWFFSVDGGLNKNIIWRQNTFHHVQSSGSNNPAFIFFWDNDATPIDGEEHHVNMVMQENTFYTLRNDSNHGASTTLYDVQDLIYEDNLAYDIDGRGVSDKDDGFRNTFRKNVFHDCFQGVAMWNQGTQGRIEINHNLIYNCGTGIVIGGQPGYLRDVYIHHNTVVGKLSFGSVIDGEQSTNIHFYNNILGDIDSNTTYSIIPIKITEPDGSYHYEYPQWFQDKANTKIKIDNNIVWTATGSQIAGFSWGIPYSDRIEWQAAGFDSATIFNSYGLDENFLLPTDSPYYGLYGHQIPD